MKYVEGADELARAFGTMPRAMEQKIEEAIRKNLVEIQKRARLLVPVDTGELRGAIDIEITRGPKGIQGRVGVLAASRASPGWYAIFVERGTAPRVAGRRYTQRGGRRRRSKNTHPGARANPFLFPAYWSMRKRASGRVKRALRAGIKAALASAGVKRSAIAERF